eukprot:3143157-Pyramimonas_sp.AAC.1
MDRVDRAVVDDGELEPEPANHDMGDKKDAADTNGMEDAWETLQERAPAATSPAHGLHREFGGLQSY